jgi:indole-3-acetate monooxygenase
VQPSFPMEETQKRRTLLAAVESVREVVSRHADEAESAGTLPSATVEALRESGLLSLTLPQVLGGAEADPVTQIEVIEAISAIDPSAGWCTMIGATAIGLPGAFLRDEAIEEMFIEGRIPTAAMIVMPAGRAIPTEGGYRLSGRWSFVSGVRHAQWIAAGAQVSVNGATPQRRLFVVPAEAVRIHDNWDVAGLQGTGSCDISIDDCYVREEFTWNMNGDLPRRGGATYKLRLPGFVAKEHAAFALGVGRCALDAVTGMAKSKRRGAGLEPSPLESRQVFQRAIGHCHVRLKAARAMVVESFSRAWAMLLAGQPPTQRMQAEMRAVAAYATEVAVDVTTQTFRFAGGGAVYRTQKLQRCLRDINVAAQHYMVSDIAYENYGNYVLGLPDVDPMR